MSGEFCIEHNCPWYNASRGVCNSPHDPWKGECDYNWAKKCPECGRLIAVGYDDDEACPFCGTELIENS